MTVVELIEKRKEKFADMSNIISVGETEQRKLSAVEITAFENIKKEVEELDKEIDERQNKDNNKKHNINIINKNMENFSLLRSIRDIVEGRNYTDATLAALEAGKNEFRKAGLTYRGQLALPIEFRADEILAGTATEGQEIVGEDKFGLLPYLRANSILVQSGAQLLSGLVGDVSIPVLGTGAAANWKTEVEAATISALEFSEITLSPKRLTTYIDISKQFLIQDSIAAENMLRNDLIGSIMDKLEATLLGAASGNTTQPAGVFYGASYTSTAATWSSIVALESAVSANNALKNGAAYLLHPTSLGTLKTTSKDSGSGRFIAEGTLINGFPFYVTSNMPTINSTKKGVLFGVMSDLLIGQWGGLDITVDPYSQAVNGKVRIIVNAYFDGKARRSASFAYANF